MSQHEPVIQDQAVYPDGLQDINDSFAAFLSQHSGTSAPGYAVAGTLWIDTDTPGSGVWTLYVYDGTDHIALGTLDITNNRFRATNHVRTDMGTQMSAVFNFNAFADIASAATTTLTNLATNFGRVTGTTTITSFDAASAGTWRLLRFAGALTLTHNVTSLILPGGANITTAAGDTALVISLGSSNWVCAMYQRASGQALVTSAASGSQYAVLEDQKSDGTDGGSSTGAAWTTHVMNTEVADPDGIVALSSNQFTLGAGSYMIRAKAVFRSTGGNGVRLRVQNITDGTTALLGLTHQFAGNTVNSLAMVEGLVTLGGSKALALQYFAQSNQINNGLGGHDGVTAGAEVYAQVVIEKLS